MFLSVLLVGAGICLCFFPLVLSIDSVYGFLAYKGTLYTQSFNMIATVSSFNIGTIEKTFVSWWSPGQWMLPAFLNYFTGIKTGIACIIITIAANCAGLMGYYRLFRYFKFSPVVVSLSLLAILCSSTFYYSYFVYQGGEVLSFGIFPWFCLYTLRLQKVNAASALCIIALFLLCFIAKSTLILYCTLILMAKSIHLTYDKKSFFPGINKWQSIFFLAVSACASITLIYFFYLSKGATPVSDKSKFFHLRISDMLIPLSSPLQSILSVREWLTRADKIITIHYTQNPIAIYYTYIVSFVLALITIFFGIAIRGSQSINSGYKVYLFFMYGGVSLFFFLSYAFNSQIGYDARHYKLLGYLFIPAMLTILYNKVRTRYIHIITLIFILLAVSDFIYLKNKWEAGRYVSTNYFYRHFDTLTNTDSLSEPAYKKLVALDNKIENKQHDSVIFFIEADPDVALDLKHMAVLPPPGKNFLPGVYYGKGPELIICVSKKTLNLTKNALKTKFPDYANFELLDETDDYLFFSAKNQITFPNLPK